MRRQAVPVAIGRCSYRPRPGTRSPTMSPPKQDHPVRDLLADAIMPFGEHLEELRRRMIYALLGLLPILVVSIVISRRLLGFVIEPVENALLDANLNAQLIQTSPTETFMTALKLAIVLTILVGSPWVFFQAWLFVAPGLYANERRFVHVLLPLSALLTASAIVFLYKLLLPVVLAFFIGFGLAVELQPTPVQAAPEWIVLPQVPSIAGDPPQPEPGQMWFNSALKQLRVAVEGADGAVGILGAPMTLSTGILQQYRVAEYTGLFLSLAISFSLAFQTPVVVLLLGWVGIIDPKSLLKFRRHVLMGCFVLSAVITPADPVSMLLLGIPLYLLFELGVLLHRVMPAERVSRGFGQGEGPDAGDE